MEVLAAENLFAFFYDRVREIRVAQGAEVQESTEFYLVNLLVTFRRSRSLFAIDGQRVDDRPIAIRLMESIGSSKGDRLRSLKHLGDSLLYVLGFFSESLRRSTVDLDYYQGLGRAAYQDLSIIAGARGNTRRDPMFLELAEKFPACVDILSGVSGTASADWTVADLLEQWLVHGNEEAGRRLEAQGCVVEPDPDGGLH